MRVQASIGAGIEGRDQRPQQAQETAAEMPKVGLPALLPMSRRPGTERRPQTRALSAVIAQLAASSGDHPSTRARRRAEPAEGASLYSLAAAVTPAARKKTIRFL
jgi:hypothetical protein